MCHLFVSNQGGKDSVFKCSYGYAIAIDDQLCAMVKLFTKKPYDNVVATQSLNIGFFEHGHRVDCSRNDVVFLLEFYVSVNQFVHFWSILGIFTW